MSWSRVDCGGTIQSACRRPRRNQLKTLVKKLCQVCIAVCICITLLRFSQAISAIDTITIIESMLASCTRISSLCNALLYICMYYIATLFAG